MNIPQGKANFQKVREKYFITITVVSYSINNDFEIQYVAMNILFLLHIQIYVDGPYGAPAEHFYEAEHAVLISSGIGVTPFASILQTIMLRYKSASHTCPNCDYSWVGNVPFSLRKLRKV